MTRNYKMSCPLYFDLEAECLYSYIKRKYNHPYMPHDHDFFEIFLIIDGPVMHFVNGEWSELNSGSLVFIRPSDTHGYKYDNPEHKDVKYINLTFSQNVANKLFSYLDGDLDTEALLTGKMPPTVFLSPKDTSYVIALLNQLNVKAWNDKKSLKLKMKGTLLEIFSRFFAETSKNTGNVLPPWLSRLTGDMKEPQNFLLGIERMCELSGKSREHISRSIKKHMGITAIDLLNGYKTNYAANLLINSNYSTIDICYMVGFESLGYFYKVFKAHEGLTPRQFRNKYSTISN